MPSSLPQRDKPRFPIGTVGGALLSLLRVYLGILLGAYMLQNALLFHPFPGPLPEPMAAGYPQLTMRHLDVPGGPRLAFWGSDPAPGKPVVLYLHGNGGSAAYRGFLVAPYAERGWGVVLAEYRGWSGNAGHPSESGLQADALAFADWAAREWPGHPLIVWGESLGTSLALGVAAERPVLGVVLDAPFTSITEVAARVYPWMPVRWLVRSPFDSMALLPKVTAPVMVVHGLADELIPPEMGRELHDAAPNPGPLLLMPGLGHTALLRDPGSSGAKAVQHFLEGLVP